jgi:lactoylglutathione lyase
MLPAMKQPSITAALFLGLLIHTQATDAEKSPSDAKPGATNPPASAEPSLRKPGFVFMELGTTRGEEYFSFFEAVAGFRIMQRQPGYIVARSDLAELSFIDPKFWAHGHPFGGKVTGSGQGVGIEIGIVVADIDKAYAEAVKFKDKGFPISTGIVRRPWGSRDFRVLVPEGYYFRFTEGH